MPTKGDAMINPTLQMRKLQSEADLVGVGGTGDQAPFFFFFNSKCDSFFCICSQKSSALDNNNNGTFAHAYEKPLTYVSSQSILSPTVALSPVCTFTLQKGKQVQRCWVTLVGSQNLRSVEQELSPGFISSTSLP